MNNIQKIKYELPSVALVGRTNVGKSTLFNRLSETKTAIVSGTPGTTRDRNIIPVQWLGYSFLLTDTAGLDIAEQKKHVEEFEEDVIKQVEIAIKTVDVILFLVDIRDGIMPQDIEVAKRLKKHKKNCILVINKADSHRIGVNQYEFTKLGFSNTCVISAKNGSRTGDLLDKVVDLLKEQKQKKISEIKREYDFKLSIIGKPNAGKSSLINSVVGEKYCAVSNTPHTTREPQDVIINYLENKILVTDTAGIRKKYKRSNKIELESVEKTLAKIDESDVCFFLLDGSQSFDHQDKSIAGLLKETNKTSIIIVVNKDDLIKKDGRTQKQVASDIKMIFPFLKWAPIKFISAKNNKNILKLFNFLLEIKEERTKVIPQNALDKILKYALKKHKTPKSELAYIYGIKQTDVNPPHFNLFVDKKIKTPTGFARRIQSLIRGKFKFVATPIFVHIRELRKK